MGLLKSIKIFFRLIKDAAKIVEQIKEQQEEYLSLSTDALSALADDELFSAAVSRAEAIVDFHDSVSEGFDALKEHQKVLYAVNYLEMEVNNGGLCQFFVNSSRAVAPYISEYLGIIGAEDHKTLFDTFVAKNQIDLTDLSSFEIRRTRDFEKQAVRYPFDEFDDAFYRLDTLETPLIAYIRKNISAF